jgi:hypothetical protein
VDPVINDLGDVPRRVAELARAPVGEGGNRWEAVERAAREVAAPAVAVHGPEAVLSALASAKSDPYVAAVLVQLSGTYGPLGGLRVTELFSDEEIVGSALSFLAAFPNAGLDDGDWAWMTLWNQWDQLEAEDHVRLVEKLIERVPWDDQMLWMIGDGPLSTVADEPANLEIIESSAAIRDKVARIWKLVEVDWPHGDADV